MVKKRLQTHSRQTLAALALLGRLIRLKRTEAKLTAQQLAARVGISRALLHRIEKGDPSASIGAVFEAATVVGVPLFEGEGGLDASALLRRTERELRLLPKAVRPGNRPIFDDF